MNARHSNQAQEDMDIEDASDDTQESDDAQEDVYRSGAKIVPATVLLIALVGFVSLGWYAYQAGSSTLTEEDLLVVEADTSPLKEAPLDPGGMQFPHQDKSVFETIASSPAAVEKSQEQLMPEPEQPVAALEEQLAQQSPSAAAPAEPVESMAMETAPALAPAAEAPTATPVPTPVATPVDVPLAPVAAAPASKAATKPAAKPVEKPAAKKPASTSRIAGNGSVQLGAFKSKPDAEAAWKKLSALPALAGKKHTVVKADLGSKGVFYRLRASGVDPKSTCAALAGKTACMPVQ